MSDDDKDMQGLLPDADAVRANTNEAAAARIEHAIARPELGEAARALEALEAKAARAAKKLRPPAPSELVVHEPPREVPKLLSKHKTIEMQKVKLAAAIDPRRAPTIRKI